MGAHSSSGRLKRLSDFSLMDLESVRGILQGTSVVDWHCLRFDDERDARDFLVSQEFDIGAEADLQRLELIKQSAVDYLRRQFDYPVPRPIEEAQVHELLMVASGKGHRQMCACTVLKVMHIIHHVEARELLFSLPISDQDLFRMIEKRVFRLVGHMMAEGFPITEFAGGRKRRDSIYTKLLSKPDAHSSAIYDKLRFRVVTRTVDDILPTLLYLTQRLFPFNYVVPGESINTVIPLRAYCERVPHLAALAAQLPPRAAEPDLTVSSNLFSAQSYRVVHFVVDLPLRAPAELLASAPPSMAALGPVIFGLCEFQIVDSETEERNETSDASHASYKARQRAAVRARLRMAHRRSSQGTSGGEGRPGD